jgi:hypothetical protein
MARKKPSPTVRPDGLPRTFREALGHGNSHPTVEALYRAELRLRDHFHRDRLAVLGVGSAVVAFLLWAWPASFGLFYVNYFFPPERLPAVAAFFALAVISLLLRRR